MNKELAKTLTTVLVQFIDRERPEGTMCCSDTECESIEKMFEGECFDIIETFIQKKLSRLTEFEKAFIERVFHPKPGDLDEESIKTLREDARFVFNLAREQLIKDGYVIEKKAFHDAVEKVSPEVMKEVSDEVDEMLEREQKPAEWSDTNELVFKDICKHLKEEGYNGWIVLLNALRNGEFQPKPEWSEEDEDMLNSCISSIEEAKENRYAYKETDGDTSYDHEIAWLKSLRPSWKPSEEQMEALDEYIYAKDPNTEKYSKAVLSLRDELKELM